MQYCLIQSINFCRLKKFDRCKLITKLSKGRTCTNNINVRSEKPQCEGRGRILLNIYGTNNQIKENFKQNKEYMKILRHFIRYTQSYIFLYLSFKRRIQTNTKQSSAKVNLKRASRYNFGMKFVLFKWLWVFIHIVNNHSYFILFNIL